MNHVAQNVKDQLPEVWEALNRHFVKDNGKVDCKARNKYLEQYIGNDFISENDESRLKWRFTNDHADTGVVRYTWAFKQVMEDENLTDLHNINNMLAKFGDNGYILDQLYVRFAREDGVLSREELKALDTYIGERVNADSGEPDWNRLKGKGVRVTDDLVEDIIRGKYHMGKNEDAYLSDTGGLPS